MRLAADFARARADDRVQSSVRMIDGSAARVKKGRAALARHGARSSTLERVELGAEGAAGDDRGAGGEGFGAEVAI
jgi:hypothetical protein